MEKKLALIGIIVEDMTAVEKVNALLHEYAAEIIGRMGLPRRESGVSIISVVIEATPDQINTLSGKLGRLSGVNCKTLQTGKSVGSAS